MHVIIMISSAMYQYTSCTCQYTPVINVSILLYVGHQLRCCLCVPGEVGRVREMLDQIPSLAHIVDKDGATPLMFAANKGHVEVGDRYSL